MLLHHSCPSAPQCRCVLPSGLRACDDTLLKLDTDQYGVASVRAQAATPPAEAEHAETDTTAHDGGDHADRRLRRATAVVLLHHSCLVAPQWLTVLPSGLRACHGSLLKPDTDQYGVATVQAQAATAPAPAKHAETDATAHDGGEHADGSVERRLSCCCTTRVPRHHSVAACCQAA